MRRFSVVLVLFAVLASTAAPAPAAVPRTSGATYLQLSEGYGFASVRQRGTFFGHVRRGRIVTTSNVHVNGCESRRAAGGNTIRCKGRYITFDTFGSGKWWIRLYGRGINGSGFVRGCLVLDGRDSGSTGAFRRDRDGDWHDWPRERTRYTLGSGSC